MTPPVVRPAATSLPPVARTRPDPRILARRIAVRRDEGRKRLRRLVACAAGLGAIGLGAAATRTHLLDVDEVTVDGAERVPLDAVLDAVTAAGAELGTPLVDIDEGAVTAAVEQLPAVAAADVDRRWPGGLVVRITERIPVAVVPAASGVALVAADGVVVDVLSSPPADLPLLSGLPDDLEPGAVVDAPDLLAVAAALPPGITASVADIVASDDGVELRLGDGGTARLGPPAELGPKLVAVATVLEQVDLTCLAVLDVRVPSAPAITKVPGCTA